MTGPRYTAGPGPDDVLNAEEAADEMGTTANGDLEAMEDARDKAEADQDAEDTGAETSKEEGEPE